MMQKKQNAVNIRQFVSYKGDQCMAWYHGHLHEVLHTVCALCASADWVNHLLLYLGDAALGPALRWTVSPPCSGNFWHNSDPSWSFCLTFLVKNGGFFRAKYLWLGGLLHALYYLFHNTVKN